MKYPEGGRNATLWMPAAKKKPKEMKKKKNMADLYECKWVGGKVSSELDA